MSFIKKYIKGCDFTSYMKKLIHSILNLIIRTLLLNLIICTFLLKTENRREKGPRMELDPFLFLHYWEIISFIPIAILAYLMLFFVPSLLFWWSKMQLTRAIIPFSFKFVPTKLSFLIYSNILLSLVLIPNVS